MILPSLNHSQTQFLVHNSECKKCKYYYDPYLTNYLGKDESNPLPKCQSVMELNILLSVSLSKESIEMIFKWRVKRPRISNILLQPSSLKTYVF